ncbi:MAG TPA: hypothetical protein VMP01_19605, partial [Pirellulaceae bacterium]|nr:hypothetical protein [Pirellulaceae bacterium]
TCFFRASDTLSLIRDTRVARTYQNIYRALAGLMLLSPALAAIAAAVFDNDSFTFFFETVAVVVFGAYWIIKTIEIRQTHADRLALDGKLELAPEGLPIGCWMQTAPAGAPATWDDRIFDVDGTLVSARQ